MEWMTILSFTGAAILLTIAPGPDNIFVLLQSISNGRRAGIATAMGLCSGLFIHTTAAALGISAIVYQSNFAFQFVKLLGVLYLFYMAFQALREGNQSVMSTSVPKQSFKQLYRKGIVMNVLNPKVSLFFLALLPQFVSKNQESVPLEMVVLGLIFIAQALILFILIALLGSGMGNIIVGNKKMTRAINYVKAITCSAIGIRLAFMD